LFLFGIENGPTPTTRTEGGEIVRIERRFTRRGQSPYEGLPFVKRSSEIRNPDGSTVFKLENIDIPEPWSQLAIDILAQKYFRKAGVPQRDEQGNPIIEPGGKPQLGGERDSRQVLERLAGCWTSWGKNFGYFKTPEDTDAFHDELCYMLAHQMAAPNSPQWFNTGLHYAYGLSGPSQGHYYVDPKTREVVKATNAFEHPQPHACFIQSIEDDLVNEGGIMDLWVREARLFKYGSGTGTNFSKLRGDAEPLSGGGRSSGLMSFLRIGDRAAGAIKSGGTTRRAAKMVCLDLDHPDIEEFINWKVVEEQKVAAMVTGSKVCAQRLNAVLRACHVVDGVGQMKIEIDAKQNPILKETLSAARRDAVPEAYIQRMYSYAQQGFTHFVFHEYDTNWDGKAYQTVSGQNSNNSVRIPNEFFEALEADGGSDRLGRLDLRGSRHAIRHYHQRVAHLSGGWPYQCLQSLLRIHVPRRYGVQFGFAQPRPILLDRRPIRAGEFPPRRAPLDDRAGDQRTYGFVSQPLHCREELSVPNAGARLCQLRYGADAARHSLRFSQSTGHLRCIDRRHDRRGLWYIG
jgi:ribonucleoside-diphosphate reductase alpha chain